MCLTSAVVASWSLTQEMTGSKPFTVMKNILVIELSELRETLRENSNISVTSCNFTLHLTLIDTNRSGRLWEQNYSVILGFLVLEIMTLLRL